MPTISISCSAARFPELRTRGAKSPAINLTAARPTVEHTVKLLAAVDRGGWTAVPECAAC